MDNCKDAPKLVWLLDIRDETHPVIVATAPLHPNDGELCTRGGRFGAHNIHPNFPGPLYANLQNTTVSTWFNGGVRIYRAVEGPKGIAGRRRRRSKSWASTFRPRRRATRRRRSRSITPSSAPTASSTPTTALPAGFTSFATPVQFRSTR